MKSKIATLIILSFTAGLDTAAVIPLPQKIEPQPGAFTLTATTHVYADFASRAPAPFLTAGLRPATGFPFKTTTEHFGSAAIPGAIFWQVPCGRITDWPRFVWRGFMLDVSRHFFTKAEVKTLLDAMTMQKLNVFHWHLTDDHGWRIEIKKYPKLTEVAP